MSYKAKFASILESCRRSNVLLDIFVRRLFTYRNRRSDYKYWREVLFLQILGFFLLSGFLYALEVLNKNLILSALIIGIAGLGFYTSRRMFLSPSSIRQQSRYLDFVRSIKLARVKGLSNVARELFNKRPGLVGTTAALLTFILSYGVMSVLKFPFAEQYAFRDVHSTVWVVHATATGFSFTVLVFFWEYLRDNFNKSRQIRVVVRNTRSFHIIYYLLIANMLIGILALVSGRPSEKVSIDPNILAAQFVLFLLSIIGVLLLYRIVYKVMINKQVFIDSLDRKIRDEIQDILTEPEQDIKKEVLIEQIDDYSQQGYSYSNEERTEFTAGLLNSSGRVSDINLHRLNDIFDMAEEIGVEIEQVPEIGRDYEKSDKLFVFRGNIDRDCYKNLLPLLKRAIKVKSYEKRP